MRTAETTTKIKHTNILLFFSLTVSTIFHPSAATAATTTMGSVWGR